MLFRSQVTVEDGALTRPWTISRTYRREANAVWDFVDCAENNPHVLVGKDYFGELLDWLTGELLADGMISPEDLDLLYVTDDIDEAIARVRDAYAGRSAATRAETAKADAQ